MYLRFLGAGFVASAVLLVLFNVLGHCEPGTVAPLDGETMVNPVFIPQYQPATETPALVQEQPDEVAAPAPAAQPEIVASIETETESAIESVLEVPTFDESSVDESSSDEPVAPVATVTQTSFALPIQETTADQPAPAQSVIASPQSEVPAVVNEPVIAYDFRMTHPAMFVRNHNLHYYRHLMRCHRAPHPHELLGTWRGVNKGPATVAIDRQFIKQFYLVNGCVCGDNIMVQQVADCDLACCGWQPIVDSWTGEIKRQGRFAVEPPQGHGRFSHGLVLNYRAGGNRDASKAIWDQVVKLDDNHMLGRATVRMGRARVPVAFFVLERIPE